MTPWLLALGSVALVSAASLIAVLALRADPDRMRRSSRYLVAFAAGGLLGDAFLHLIPESFERLPGGSTAPLLTLAGLLGFFVFERRLRSGGLHHRWHHLPPVAGVNLLGDALHNAVDGMVIAASFQVSIPIGLTTSAAVLLHELPQEIGDFGVLVHQGLPARRAIRYNLLSSLTAFVGVGVVALVGVGIGDLASYLLPVTAGGFLYLAGADLLPELQHDAGERSIAVDAGLIAAGVALMAALGWLE